MSSQDTQGAGAGGAWIAALRWYLPYVALANLLWETLHLPLYTVWQEGSAPYLAFVVLHCTGGDVLIALATLALALLAAAPARWPLAGAARVALLTTAGGAGYTVFSEWLNVVIRKSWKYSELMPVVPIADVGLAPLLQWLVIPPLGLWLVHRVAAARLAAAGRDRSEVDRIA